MCAFECALSGQVEEFRGHRDFCRIRLFFESNPYFHNKVIVKKYVIHITGKSRLSRTGMQVVGGSWPVIQAGPMYTFLFSQDTGRVRPPQFSGPSTMHEKRTAAGSTTAALTSSTGSVTTTLRALAGLLRWGLPDQRKRNVVGVHAAWFWDLSSHHPDVLFSPGRSSVRTCGPIRCSTM